MYVCNDCKEVFLFLLSAKELTELVENIPICVNILVLFPSSSEIHILSSLSLLDSSSSQTRFSLPF